MLLTTATPFTTASRRPVASNNLIFFLFVLPRHLALPDPLSCTVPIVQATTARNQPSTRNHKGQLCFIVSTDTSPFRYRCCIISCPTRLRATFVSSIHLQARTQSLPSQTSACDNRRNKGGSNVTIKKPSQANDPFGPFRQAPRRPIVSAPRQPDILALHHTTIIKSPASTWYESRTRFECMKRQSHSNSPSCQRAPSTLPLL